MALKLYKSDQDSEREIHIFALVAMEFCISEHPVFLGHSRLRMLFSDRDQNLFLRLNLAPVRIDRICGSLRGYRLDF